jgi:hypothetical protein
VLGRINAILAAGEDRNGTGRDAGAMPGGVDAARQSRCDGKSRLRQCAREPLGDLHASGRGIARADDGDERHRQHASMAADREQRRGVIDHLQTLRIVGLAECHQRNAELGAGFNFPLGLLTRANLRTAGAAATARQPRQGFECRARPAEMIEQRPKSARPDILASNEPQPVEPPGHIDLIVVFAGVSRLCRVRDCGRRLRRPNRRLDLCHCGAISLNTLKQVTVEIERQGNGGVTHDRL